MASFFLWIVLAACVSAVPDNYYYITVHSSNGSTAVGVIANSSFGDNAFSISQPGLPHSRDPNAGPECVWGGIKGTCVPERQCLTTLDQDSPKQPNCPQTGGDVETTICCTDCDLVNSTSNAVYRPDSGLGLFWKTGQKSWDRCLQNLLELPTKCHPHLRGKLRRHLDAASGCHRFELTSEGHASPDSSGDNYPHSVVLGYGSTYVFSMAWFCFGTIISEKFVLSAAQCYRSEDDRRGYAMYAVLGLMDREPSAPQLQHRRVLCYRPHPDYVHPYGAHDIALYETDSPISFNKFVSPACLPAPTPASAELPAALLLATWRDLKDGSVGDKLSTVVVRRYSPEECSAQYPPHWDPKGEWFGFDDDVHLCYGDKALGQTCMIHGGEALLARQVSRCLYTVVGVRTYDRNCGSSNGVEIYTRVSHYVPWIESVVWPN